MKIRNSNIGNDCPPFIIAELSGNHHQSLEKALQMVDEAARAGAHAVKLQTYTPETMTIDIDREEFLIKGDTLWDNQYLFDLYKKAYTPWEWHSEIFDRCKKNNIIGFSTPFDASAVDFLESLNVECYKIASFENSDTALLRMVGQTKKPVFVSTGMASIAELDDAISTLRTNGCKDIVLLKCTSSYPASPHDSNILTIPHMKQLFNCHVGLSDHTLGIGVSVASVAVGSVVIEKHFTLSRDEEGVDSKFSLEPYELKFLVEETKRAWESLGHIHYGPTEAEVGSIQFRRSLFIVEDMQKFDILTTKNIRSIRPGNGLSPKFLDIVLGRRINCSVKRGTPLNWELIS